MATARQMSSKFASSSSSVALPAAPVRRRAGPVGGARSRAVRLQPVALLKQADGLQVTWSQTVDDVAIRVPVPADVRGRELQFEIKPKRLSLKLRGQELLHGGLEDVGAVNADECYWVLEEEGGSKFVAITLAKKSSGYLSWDALLESEKADTTITDRVFLEVSVDGEVAGKIAIGLFGKTVPRTVENFKALCTGEKGMGGLGKPLHFTGSPFHRIIPGFMAQGGDITAGNGTGGESIYGPNFDDENFKIKHDEAGMVAMANAGPGTNSSQFYILFNPAPHLNGKHVVFGRVLGGMDIVRRLESLGSPQGATTSPVTITNCGLLEDEAAVEKLIDDNKLLALGRD